MLRRAVSLGCMSLLLLFSSLRGALLCAEAAPPSDLEMLNVLATGSQNNTEKIRTWQGHANMAETFYLNSSRRERESDIAFVYDAVSGNVRSSNIVKKFVETDAAGHVSSLLAPDVFSMIKDGNYYVFRRNSPEQHAIVTRATGETVEVNGRDFRRSVLVSASPPDDVWRNEEHFDPMGRQFPKRRNYMRDLCMSAYERQRERELHELPEGVVIRRSGEIVTLRVGASDNMCNVYTVDLARGALLIRYETRIRGAITESWMLEPQLISGVWIPRKTTYNVKNLANDSYAASIDWRGNVINEPVKPEEFSLVKMELRRGDQIEDTRTGTMTRIVDDAFPPPEPNTEVIPEARANRWRLIAGLFAVIALAGGMSVYWIRKTLRGASL